MKSLILIVIMTLSLSLSGCSTTIDGEKNLENEKWIEDINYLDENLRSKHPDLFRYVSEEEWESQITNLKEDVDNLSDLDIALNIAKIVSLIQDGHTEINVFDVLTPIEKGEEDINEVVIFPIIYAYFDDGLRVLACDEEYEHILGSRLVAINDIEIDEVIQKLYTLVSYDNHQSAKEKIRGHLPVYEILEFLNIVNDEVAKYEFMDDKNNSITLDIKAEKNKDINLASLKSKPSKTSQTPEGESNFYWFEHFEEDEILYFKYNRCMSDESYYLKDDEKHYYDSYFKFEKRLVEKINNTGFDKFVIDLRDNPGGNLAYIDSLLVELKSNTQLEGEDIVVISGKRTFSAAGILTWKLQDDLDATIIGEETGGNVNIFGNVMVGETGSILLPNSKLSIIHGSMPVENEKGYEGGVKPDVEIIQNYEDYLNGIDTCYEYIRNMGKIEE